LTYEDMCGKGVHQISFAQVDVEKASEYSCEDSDQCLDVHGVLWPRIQADAKLRAIYDIEIATSEAFP
jgi:DNA polymerase-1